MIDLKTQKVNPCNFAASTCPAGMEYNSCGSACVSTCSNYFTTKACTLPCVEGCFCPDDKVRPSAVLTVSDRTLSFCVFVLFLV